MRRLSEPERAEIWDRFESGESLRSIRHQLGRPPSTTRTSPSHERVTVHIGAYMSQGPDRERYFSGFERSMLDLGGRPHPGKEHGLVPADLLTRFAKGTDFRNLAFDLDPDGMFANTFLDRWLGTRTSIPPSPLDS